MNSEEMKKDVFLGDSEEYGIALVYFPKAEAERIYNKIVNEMGRTARFIGIESDPLSGFVKECCLTGPGLKENSSNLYKTFCKWHREKIGGDIPSQTWFGRHLIFKKTKSTGRIIYNGIALKHTLSAVEGAA